MFVFVFRDFLRVRELCPRFMDFCLRFSQLVFVLRIFVFVSGNFFFVLGFLFVLAYFVLVTCHRFRDFSSLKGTLFFGLGNFKWKNLYEGKIISLFYLHLGKLLERRRFTFYYNSCLMNFRNVLMITMKLVTLFSPLEIRKGKIRIKFWIFLYCLKNFPWYLMFGVNFQGFPSFIWGKF